MNFQHGFARQQSGMMLIESLLAILVFSLGILALVGLQGMAIKQSTDARYRTEAALLANDIIGQMWVSDRTTAGLVANFDSITGGAAYNTWRARVGGVLPGAAANPPVITIDPQGIATVTVHWVAPNDPNTTLLCNSTGIRAHCHVAIAQIR
jgi:type IV pilus assembly protein PilV